MKKLIIGLAIVIVGGGLFIFLQKGGGSGANETASTPALQNSATGQVVEIDMTAKQWEFIPSVITVNQGDLVRITATSIDVPHGFALPEFNVSEYLSPGQPVTFEFVADKKGTFTFFCNVACGQGHSQMRGTLIVQ